MSWLDPRTRTRRGAGRLAALVCLLVLASDQLGALVHQLTVVHARCEAHGELVHAGGGHGGVRAAPRDSIGLPVGGDADDHEACDIVLGLHAAAALPAATALSTCQLGEPPRSLPAAPPARAIAVLAVAPKTSPPV